MEIFGGCHYLKDAETHEVICIVRLKFTIALQILSAWGLRYPSHCPASGTSAGVLQDHLHECALGALCDPNSALLHQNPGQVSLQQSYTKSPALVPIRLAMCVWDSLSHATCGVFRHVINDNDVMVAQHPAGISLLLSSVNAKMTMKYWSLIMLPLTLCCGHRPMLISMCTYILHT